MSIALILKNGNIRNLFPFPHYGFWLKDGHMMCDPILPSLFLYLTAVVEEGVLGERSRALRDGKPTLTHWYVQSMSTTGKKKPNSTQRVGPPGVRCGRRALRQNALPLGRWTPDPDEPPLSRPTRTLR